MGFGSFLSDFGSSLSGIPLVGGLVGGVFQGLGGAIEGPESPGKPVRTPSQRAIDEEEAELTGTRADIVRRNLLRQSSTAVTGAEFIQQQQQGFRDVGGPISEVEGIENFRPENPFANSRFAANTPVPFGGFRN